MMKPLNLPTYSLKIKSESDLEYVYDQFRRKYVRLTPEEWVRQNFAHYLVNEKSYPASRMILEKSLRFNKMSKRCDILVSNDSGEPIVMIECKAPDIKIGQNTFEQVSVYNIVFHVEYLIITNGLQHYCCIVDFEKRSVNFMNEIPDYEKIRKSGTH
jgi:hypothetical protein